MIARRRSAWHIGACILAAVGLSGHLPGGTRSVPHSEPPAFWRTETVDEVPAPRIQNGSLSPGEPWLLSATVSVAVDADNNPHLSYIRGGRLLHAFRDAGSWTTEVVEAPEASIDPSVGPFSNLAFNNCQIAIAADGDIHIAYGSRAGLVHAARNGDAWSSVVVDDSAAAMANVSLVLGASGTPHITYGVGDIPWLYNVKYASRASQVWRADRIGSIPGSNSYLSVDGDVPYVVLSLRRGFQYTLYYATRGTDWTVETITKDGGENVSVAVDSQGRPHVAWAVAGAVRHAWRIGHSEWQTEEYPEVAEPTWSLVAMAIDAMDNVHIAHCYQDGLRYLVRGSSGAWNVETVDEEAMTGFPVNRLSLALDSRGQPHIGYVGANPLRCGPRLVRYAHRVP